MKRIEKYKIDFVIPLCRYNLLFPVVIEAIVEFYKPRNVYIITSVPEIAKIKTYQQEWKTEKTRIRCIKEETFFQHHYHTSLENIKKWYTYRNENSREFGWWYQQLLKLGAVYRIKNLSKPFVVWDADLIPLQKWSLYPTYHTPEFHFALLQDTERNEFRRVQYQKSLYALLKLPEIHPTNFQNKEEEGDSIGTFIPHHFIFHPHIIRCFIRYIEKIHHCTQQNPWFRVILQLSRKYYLFSEYKNLATFMAYFFPQKLCYHSLFYYGNGGIFLCSKEETQKFIQELNTTIRRDNSHISYRDFTHYLYFKYEDSPTYVHVESSNLI
jgi:hypothetical protein